MTTIRRLCALVLAVTMLAVYFPAEQMEVHAADRVGTLSNSDHTAEIYYYNFSQLVNDLEDKYEGKTVTITMNKNWDSAEDSDFDQRLIIPSKCKATLDMNGYVFDRNNTADNDWSYNGELICVESGASLTINGGEKKEHNEVVYSSTSRDGKATKWKKFFGGVLTGGASTGGAGGIHIKSDCTVTLNDVTLAGCRAEAPWYDIAGTNSAYGGGIWIKGGNSNLRMNNSTITGCFAYYDGGGIFQSNHNYVNIELKNSHIDANYAADEGGGIDVDGEYSYIIGDGNSTVSNNEANNTGGGIYLWNDNMSVSGLKMEGNKGKNGGAIYSQEQTINLAGLVIKNNTATERGGGIYINNNANTISGCEITNNRAGTSGAGVYVNSDVNNNFRVIGKTIIRGNNGHDLYLSDGTAGDNRVNFGLTKGSEVRMSYYNTNDREGIMVTQTENVKSPNCIQYLRAGNQGYHFTFNAKPNERKIYYVKNGIDNRDRYGDPVEIPDDPTRIYAEDGAKPVAVAEVAAGGEVDPDGEYDLIRGFFRHEKYDSDTEDTDSVFYYSDAFFDDDPTIYNEHLASASWALTMAGTYLRRSEEADANGSVYYNKHGSARQFLADIGCPDENIYVNEDNTKKPGTDTIGVTIGSKELAKRDGTKTGYILVPVTVRGGGYEAEWASNVTLGTAQETHLAGKEAKGFGAAATHVMEGIEEYIKKYDLRDKLAAGKVVFWVTGFSRAGATANITSKRLVEKYACSDESGKNNKVFGYPCEAPKGGTDEAEQLKDEEDKSKYYCIHNMINAADLVPLVGPEEMGFKRYGVDHYIPGDDAQYPVRKRGPINVNCGGNQGVRTVTTYHDNLLDYQGNNKDGNESGSVEANETYRFKQYNQETSMYSQLQAIDSGMIYDNYFHPMTMEFIPPKMLEAGNYKGNHVEDFLTDFVRFMQEGDGSNGWSKAIESRDKWANDYQPIMRDVMSLLFSMSSEDSAGFIGRAQSIIDKIDYMGGSDVTMWELYRNVIGEWKDLDSDDREKYTTFFWRKLTESGAFDFISESDQTKLQKHWPVLMDMIFRMVDGDYNFKPGNHNTESQHGYGWAGGSDKNVMYLSTLATFSSYILLNHGPEINFAWVRSYDDYYKKETTEYKIATGELPAPEAIAVDSADNEFNLHAGTDQLNRLFGDQEIKLSVNSVNGEAIYYDVQDRKTGKMIIQNKLYQGDLGLKAEADTKKYQVTTYAMFYSRKSEKHVYNIDLYSDVHIITLNAKDEQGNNKQWTSRYREGDKVVIPAIEPSGYFFRGWKVYLQNEDGTVLGDNETIETGLLGEEGKNSVSASFVMPKVGDVVTSSKGNEFEYPAGYYLTFQAEYGERVKKVDVMLEEPTAGEELDANATIRYEFDAASPQALVERQVSWTYKHNDKTVQTSGEAYNRTAYTATIHIPQDKKNNIIFAEDLTGEYNNKEVTSITRDASDGSATVVITFDPTEDGDNLPPTSYADLTINAWDLNLKGYDPETDPVEMNILEGSEAVLTAPDVTGERFMQWDFKEADQYITLVEDSEVTDRTIKVKFDETIGGEDLAIDAQYIPVVKEIKAEIEAPVGGEKMTDSATVTTKISNVYEIDPDFVRLTWSPEPVDKGEEGDFADYLKSYVATVTVEPKQKVDDEGQPVTDEYGKPVMYIRAKMVEDKNGNPIPEEEQEYNETSAVFFYSDDLKVTADGERTAYDVDANSLYCVFPMTTYKLISVEKPADVTGVAHGTDEIGIKEFLPKTVRLTTDQGVSFQPGVKWTLTPPEVEDARMEKIWTAHGKVTELPEEISNPNNVELEFDINVTVKEADHVSSPAVTLPSGSYLYDQMTTIDAKDEPGYSTYYTTDRSDPKTSNTRKKYTGEVIPIQIEAAGSDKSVVIKAYTAKDDGSMWDSMVVTYKYTFDGVPIPESSDVVYNGRKQIGVNGSTFYKLTAEKGSGVTIDKNGNAVAVKPGKYKVIAKIKKGFRWKIRKAEPDDTGGEYEYTTDDQTVIFEIKKIPVKTAKIAKVKNRTYTGKSQRPAVKVTLNGAALKAGRDYKAVYSNNKKVGTAKVRIVGIGNYTGISSYRSFKIVPKKAVIKKAKVGKRKVTLKFKVKPAKTGGSKYQIKYRIKGKKKWKTKTTKKIKLVLKKLKKGKKYQIKARAFKKVGKKKYYGKWSKVKVTKKIRKK